MNEEVEVEEVEEAPICPFLDEECPHPSRVSDAWCSCCLTGAQVRATRLLRITGQR